MSNTLMAEPKATAAARASMLASGSNYPSTRWAVYVNADLCDLDCGAVRFLATGPDNTFKDAPTYYPDTPHLGTGWRYVLRGYIDPSTGIITEKGLT